MHTDVKSAVSVGIVVTMCVTDILFGYKSTTFKVVHYCMDKLFSYVESA